MRPVTEAELAEAVAGASGPLLVRGGGTRTLGHAVGEVLETGGLSGVELYEPGALTLVVRAGTPVAEVEAVLAGERQRLAFEVPDLRGLLGREGVSTIGGVVAANASGPRRVQVGAARDACLGARFVDGAGMVVKNGGRVMKNVTGYDLVKLMAGSRGTLGVLTEVSFKVQAIPEAEATLVIEGLGDAAGLAALRAALGSPFDVSGAARHSGRSLVRVEGMAGSVAYRVTQLRARLGGDVTVAEGAESAALWREVRDVVPMRDKPGEIWRIVTLPTAAAEIVAQLEGEALWDWGGGLIWLVLPHGKGADLAAAVAGRGHATLVKGQGGPVFPPEAPEVAALVAGLKAKFDPRGILNRGMMG
ncbi:FAD-binding protein [Rhodobacter calidifons]|uniref:FAD-binding protein n=1 Tax=Rhodobacter calidifons TaxID=2715277 RepID=A0ABX0G2F4_9RHOB|nr:FAD-binding protein [Rhodobacter calidifons]NHB75335.1 FAD-binding protein [Rhodobacter calidifons]